MHTVQIISPIPSPHHSIAEIRTLQQRGPDSKDAIFKICAIALFDHLRLLNSSILSNMLVHIRQHRTISRNTYIKTASVLQTSQLLNLDQQLNNELRPRRFSFSLLEIVLSEPARRTTLFDVFGSSAPRRRTLLPVQMDELVAAGVQKCCAGHFGYLEMCDFE